MAITPTLKVANYDNTNLTTYTTTAWTPTADTLNLIYICGNRGAAIDAAPTLANHGDFSSWTLATDGTTAANLTAAISGGFARMTAHWAVADSSPASDSLDITASNPLTGLFYAVIELTGTNQADPIEQVDTTSGTSTSASITHAAFAQATNIALACFAHNANEATTPGGSYAELTDNASTAPVMGHQVEWLVNDTGPSASWATSSAFLGISIEIAAAAAASVELPSLVMAHR